MMRRAALTMLALLAIPATAQIYQWQDDKGRTVISDRPPSQPTQVQKKSDSRSGDVQPAAPSTGTAKTLADREMEFRQRQKEARASAEKAEQEQKLAVQKQQACDEARRALQALESGERLAMRDSRGERYYLDDAQRQEQSARARAAVKATCE